MDGLGGRIVLLVVILTAIAGCGWDLDGLTLTEPEFQPCLHVSGVQWEEPPKSSLRVGETLTLALRLETPRDSFTREACRMDFSDLVVRQDPGIDVVPKCACSLTATAPANDTYPPRGTLRHHFVLQNPGPQILRFEVTARTPGRQELYLTAVVGPCDRATFCSGSLRQDGVSVWLEVVAP